STVSRLELELKRPVLLESERSMPTDARADLIARRVRAACALGSRMTGEVVLPAHRERLKEILDRPEFGEARDRGPDWLARWLGRLGDWLRSFLEAEGAQSFASFTRALVLGLAVAAALAAILRLARTRRAASPATPRSDQRQAERLRDPAEHLMLAR